MRSINKNNIHTDTKGIAIYVAVTITAALILVSFSVISLALKQIVISSTSRDSQAAFYAADSGVECALFWDLKNTGGSLFATSTGNQTISCNSISSTVTKTLDAGTGVGTSTFSYSFTPDPYCVSVWVTKSYNGSTIKTNIEARGYNSCSTTNQRRVERAIRANY